MWIDRRVYEQIDRIANDAAERIARQRDELSALRQQVADLKTEIVRHVADKDWFKHRLNQVEMERSALIYAATGGHGQVPAVRDEGVKIPAPRFAEGPTMADTLNHQYNPFGTVGDDSLDPQDQIPGAVSEDLTHMPGFKG